MHSWLNTVARLVEAAVDDGALVAESSGGQSRGTVLVAILDPQQPRATLTNLRSDQ